MTKNSPPAPEAFTLEAAQTIQRTVGYTFKDTALLVRAMTHASIAVQRSDSNERLEFLGDAVLGLVVCRLLYLRNPAMDEGEMTKVKSTVVSRRTCGEIANELGLSDALLLGKGMREAALPHSLAAATFEAIIGAIYCDANCDTVAKVVEPLLRQRIESAVADGHQQNFKSILQQYGQDHAGAAPEYVLLDEQGPDHAKCFEVCAELAGTRYASKWGVSKKQAEQNAAQAALEAVGVLKAGDEGRSVVDQAALKASSTGG